MVLSVLRVLLLISFQTVSQTTALRMVEFEVPKFPRYGKRAVLKCKHHIDYRDGSLYSVKWYKVGSDGTMTNFYTYKGARGVGGSPTKQTKHGTTGLRVLARLSNEHQVVLKKVRIDSSGFYKCEVTTKKDKNFDSPWGVISDKARMQVVALPDERPTIMGGGPNYAYGDLLDLNCTSKPSYPPTRHTWHVNNHPALQDVVSENLLKTQDQLYLTQSRLTMRVSQAQFRNGEIRIRCVASITEEPIQAGGQSGGLVLEILQLPEALKLTKEDIFDVPVTSDARRKSSHKLHYFLPVIHSIITFFLTSSYFGRMLRVI